MKLNRRGPSARIFFRAIRIQCSTRYEADSRINEITTRGTDLCTIMGAVGHALLACLYAGCFLAGIVWGAVVLAIWFYKSAGLHVYAGIAGITVLIWLVYIISKRTARLELVGVIGEYIAAKKSRYCPRVEFVDADPRAPR